MKSEKKSRQICLRVTDDTYAYLERIAEQREWTITHVIEWIIRQYKDSGSGI